MAQDRRDPLGVVNALIVFAWRSSSTSSASLHQGSPTAGLTSEEPLPSPRTTSCADASAPRRRRVAAQDADHRRDLASGQRRCVPGEASASSSTQKTYSQARSGWDATRARSCSGRVGKDAKAARSVPARSTATSVVRIGRPGPARRRRPARAEHEEPRAVVGQVADLVRQDLEAEQRRRRGATGPRRTHARRASTMDLPAPAVLYVERSCHGRVRRNASAWPSAWMCE